MNFLSNLGSSLQFLHLAKQQLQGMHTMIDAKQIPVEKSDDFFQQAIDLERSLGDKAYAQSLSRYQSARKAMIAIASVVLVIAVAFYALSKFGPTSNLFQTVLRQITSDFLLFATTISVVSIVLLAGLVAGSFYVRSLEKKLLGKDLSALWSRVLKHWMPELAQQHDIANTPPESIASLVGVQARIQDVDLELR